MEVRPEILPDGRIYVKEGRMRGVAIPEWAKSRRLKEYRGCIGAKMKGSSGTRDEIREAFKKAAKECGAR